MSDRERGDSPDGTPDASLLLSADVVGLALHQEGRARVDGTAVLHHTVGGRHDRIGIGIDGAGSGAQGAREELVERAPAALGHVALGHVDLVGTHVQIDRLLEHRLRHAQGRHASEDPAQPLPRQQAQGLCGDAGGNHGGSRRRREPEC